ncbi:hypothetical protein D1AOALGA4SA_3703 [Olavius algarvensis Delta 1 endosymbiont]|nr:hypothetical protein D1AOALGA4SA_3703 [Olavius algarvensis Delta 1 endosymbiont]
MLDYSEITAEPDLDFAKRLTAEFGVAAIQPSVFITPKCIIRSCDSILPKRMKPCSRQQKSYAGFSR